VLQAKLDTLSAHEDSVALYEAQAKSAAALLTELRERLVGDGLDFETKREIVRTLVGQIRVDTEGTGHRKVAHVSMRYWFGDPRAVTVNGSITPSAVGELPKA